MGASRRVLKTKTFYPVTQFAQRRCSRSAREAAADDYDLKLSSVVRINQSRMVLVISPFLVERSWRNFRIQRSNHASDICLELQRSVLAQRKLLLAAPLVFLE